MTPLEKAQEIYQYFDEYGLTYSDKKACSIYAVNLILKELDEFLLDEKDGFEHYFELVKEELEKLYE